MQTKTASKCWNDGTTPEGALFDGIGIVAAVFSQVSRFGNVSYALGRTLSEADCRDYFELMAEFDVPNQPGITL